MAALAAPSLAADAPQSRVCARPLSRALFLANKTTQAGHSLTCSEALPPSPLLLLLLVCLSSSLALVVGVLRAGPALSLSLSLFLCSGRARSATATLGLLLAPPLARQTSFPAFRFRGCRSRPTVRRRRCCFRFRFGLSLLCCLLLLQLKKLLL